MSRPETASPKAGSLRSIISRLSALILVRAELFAMEAEEQKNRLLHNFLLAGMALLALLFAMISGLILVVALTPPALRITVFAILTLAGLAICLLLFWRIKRRISQQAHPFSLTLSEVRKDCRLLFPDGSRNEVR